MNDHTPEKPIDILLIEDNPGDVRLTQEAFKTIHSSVNFHVIADGKEISEYFDVDGAGEPPIRPDVVLLDLNLPQVDGFTVLGILKEELDYPPPPILILSSSRAKEDIIESYERAANAYLTKPDSLDEFNSMAQAIEDFWVDSAQHPPAPT